MSGAATAPRGAAFVAESRWIRRVPRPGAGLRLVCLPFAGGGASVFQPLARLLPERVEVLVVQPPGREDRSREAPPGDVAALARAVAIALRPYGGVPYALYGHCAGALLAYEVAHEMGRRFGMWPQRLLAGAQGAPHLPPDGEPLHRMDDRALLETVSARGGLPEAVAANPAFVEFLLPVLRADFALWERYEFRPRPPLPCPVTTVRGAEDTLVSPESAQAWREHTSGGWTDVTVPGGHYFITAVSEETARTFAEALSADR